MNTKCSPRGSRILISKKGLTHMFRTPLRRMVCHGAMLAIAALGILLLETINAVGAGKPPQEPALQTKPASRPVSHLVGQNGDESAQAASGSISHSEGSFDSATGITSECEVQCPNNQCPKNPSCSGQPSNEFTLQLNTNNFYPAACNIKDKISNCNGEVQFVFTNSQCQTKDFYPHSPSKACVYIEYWLHNYSATLCPSLAWTHSLAGTDCSINSTNYTPVPPQVVTGALLESLKLTGEVVPRQVVINQAESAKVTNEIQQDKVTLTIGSTAYSALGDFVLPELGSAWTASEFNIFGDGHESQAVFNGGSGTTLLVRTVVNNGTASAPKCCSNGNTLESNNLNLLGTCSPVGGASPAIVFPEGSPVAPNGSTVVLYDGNAGQADVVGFDVNGKQSMDFPNTYFRTSWSLIAAGNFTGGKQQQVVLYDSNAGQVDVVDFDANGKADMDAQNPGLGTSFDEMIAGYFIGNGREQVLLYNSTTGEADLVAFGSNGEKNLDTKDLSFGKWNWILPGDFLGLKYGQQQVFVYNRSAGHAGLIAFDSEGTASPPALNTKFRTSWDLIVAGRFIGNGEGPGTEGVVLYDRAAGEADVVGFGSDGVVNLDHTNSGFRRTWTNMVAGSFLGDHRDEILLYDQNAGDADVVAFDTSGGESLDHTNHGFRTSWSQMASGDFIGSSGKDQVLLYDGNAGEVDVVAFDSKGGVLLDGQNNRYPGSSDLIAVGAFVPK